MCIDWKFLREGLQVRNLGHTITYVDPGSHFGVLPRNTHFSFLSKIVQEKATNEKFILEEAQRKGHRERREAGVEWIPKLFERDPAAPNAINRWVYKYRE